MVASLSQNTIKQYNTALKKWWYFCNGVNIYELSIPKILKFLTEMLSQGASYATLNTCRSALSLIIDNSVGTDLQIKRFFKGVFKIKPSRPKYNDTWDPSVILNHIQNWSPNSSLNLEKLTKKLVILLALTTAQRIQTLSVIRLSNIEFTDTGVKITITDFLKTTTPCKDQVVIKLPSLDMNPEICPVSTLQHYIDLTSSLRDVDSDKLLISYKKPHNCASNQTISRWIRQVMAECGIDVKKFTPHSTRHASTSLARREGVTLDCIFKAAGWSTGSSVFANHYNRPLCTDEDNYNFSRAICNVKV